jgi:hypothetical protein
MKTLFLFIQLFLQKLAEQLMAEPHGKDLILQPVGEMILNLFQVMLLKYFLLMAITSFSAAIPEEHGKVCLLIT